MDYRYDVGALSAVPGITVAKGKPTGWVIELAGDGA